jgi:uncharacterized protein (TIGR03382 family)
VGGTSLLLWLLAPRASAVEICNASDDDADGEIDEGPVLASADGDGDGHGDDLLPELFVDCAAIPVGFVPDAADCDDADAAIGPGAVETCDAVDEDCDGLFDDGACAGEVETEDESAWMLVFDVVGWDAAIAGCAAVPGWQLGTPGDSQEQGGLRQSTDPYNDQFWIGFTDAAYEGTWVWLDGTPTGYTHWRTGEPNNGLGPYTEEDCATIEPTGTWSDADCALEVWPYVCETDCVQRYWYADEDGDGLGDSSDENDECETLDGRVANVLDCDDTDPEQPTVAYVDADGDGYGGTERYVDCVEYPPPPGDCDDGDGSSFPGATDVPGDGIDQDCLDGDAIEPPDPTGTPTTPGTDTTPSVPEGPADSDGDGVPDALDPDPFDAGGAIGEAPKPGGGCGCAGGGPGGFAPVLLVVLRFHRVRRWTEYSPRRTPRTRRSGRSVGSVSILRGSAGDWAGRALRGRIRSRHLS